MPEAPPNRYLPMPFFGQADDKEWEEDEEGKSEYEDGEEELANDEDFDDVFRPEQPSIGGVKICTPSRTYPTSYEDMRATAPDMSQEKDPMIE
ncbi:hypothetical protein PVK06_035183 [Gossypium arboreum]|uniref:Uncharacterized protein n=1 Tax=Gossypium arboreum TaxID=29729 RepID=A0ABR0NG60_GOSAR|nr:hypothetical protein PVK06_035183 [Gossypium arboreum]